MLKKMLIYRHVGITCLDKQVSTWGEWVIYQMVTGLVSQLEVPFRKGEVDAL